MVTFCSFSGRVDESVESSMALYEKGKLLNKNVRDAPKLL